MNRQQHSTENIRLARHSNYLFSQIQNRIHCAMGKFINRASLLSSLCVDFITYLFLFISLRFHSQKAIFIFVIEQLRECKTFVYIELCLPYLKMDLTSYISHMKILHRIYIVDGARYSVANNEKKYSMFHCRRCLLTFSEVLYTHE